MIDPRIIPKLRNYLMAFEQFLADAETTGEIMTSHVRREAYDQGFINGKLEGVKEGKSKGFQDGYEDGYNAGLRARVAAPEAEDASEET